MKYEEFKPIVIKMLKEYQKLDGRIMIAERKAEGGRIPFFDPLRDALKKQELADVGQAYSVYMAPGQGYIYQEKAETLFHNVKGVNEKDEAALDDIRGIMIGTYPKWWWDIDNPEKRPVVVDGVVMPFGTAKERAREKAMEKVEELRYKKEFIERSLRALKTYSPEAEELLRLKYIENNKDSYVRRRMNINAERTFDHRKRYAITEFANLIGLIDG